MCQQDGERYETRVGCVGSEAAGSGGDQGKGINTWGAGVARYQLTCQAAQRASWCHTFRLF